MSKARTPLFVRLPKEQAVALDRLAETTGRRKQFLVSELLGDRLETASPLAVGRVEVTGTSESDEVLTLEEVARLLKVAPDVARAHAEGGEVPGRRIGNEWRFSRMSVLAWLAGREPKKSRR